MTNHSTTTPLTVPASPVPEQLTAAIRTLLAALGGYAVAKGWLTAEVAAAIVPVLLIGGPLLWSQFRILRANAVMKAMADKLPDSVATVA